MSTIHLTGILRQVAMETCTRALLADGTARWSAVLNLHPWSVIAARENEFSSLPIS